ncbi:hypothetical protein M082_4111 [Bacteroides fragilis str. 3725 D9 ii]|nr:hypothetical protein M082_4111 [Bacteroides fragilis str. 3725 D9 ii]
MFLHLSSMIDIDSDIWRNLSWISSLSVYSISCYSLGNK